MSFLEEKKRKEKKSGEWTISRKMTRQKHKRTRQKKKKRGDRKRESNNSPEIPDRRVTSDTPGLPSGIIRDGNVT